MRHLRDSKSVSVGNVPREGRWPNLRTGNLPQAMGTVETLTGL